MKFSRKKFFDGFRDRIDSTIEQEQVDGLEFLLGKIERDPFWKHIPQIAYALATTGHETAWSFQPVEEGYYLEERFGIARVKSFQKSLRYYPWFGRGYVQLTWEENYKKAGRILGNDLGTNPNLALDREIAYTVLTFGMHQGWFTGKKLDDYIRGSKKDYEGARKIINGTDKAGRIAGYARSFEKILTAAVEAEPVANIIPDAEIDEIFDPMITGPAMPKPEPLADLPEDIPALPDSPPATVDPAGEPQVTDPPPSLVPAITPVVEVETVVAGPSNQPPPESFFDKVEKTTTRAAAIQGAAPGILAAIGTWFASNSWQITAIVIGAAVVGAAVWMIVNTVRSNKKQAIASEMDKERLKLEYEAKEKADARAHEIQMATIQSAMNKNMNTIRIVPPPPGTQIPNTEDRQ